MTPSVVFGRLDQLFHFLLGQMLALLDIQRSALRLGAATVRFSLAGVTTFRCRIACIFRSPPRLLCI